MSWLWGFLGQLAARETSFFLEEEMTRSKESAAPCHGLL